MDLVLTRDIMTQISGILDQDLLRAGADCALLVDRAGYVLANRGDPSSLDVMALAALSAANYGASAEIAQLIGEEDFDLMFHKGKRENIHYAKIGTEHFLITLFARNVSLGVIRLKTATVARKILPILKRAQ
jgi:predicted regulator of Ras-like GTPase activity (Roadblock/LC7/MglB family)